MKAYESDKKNDPDIIREAPATYGMDAEEQRLLRIINMPDIEKLKSFTKMLRRNALLKKASITHKD